MHIIKTIKRIIKTKPAFFTTPGHLQGFHTMEEFAGLFGRKLFCADLSEVEGMDNLQNPEESILRSLKRASGIYGSKATFYLVNGSSSGILALILATVGEGEKILIARNAHKSVINALVLSGAVPVWLETGRDDYWNIFTHVKPEKITKKLDENPGIKAVWITSPTYEGVVSDIKQIAEICKKREVILLVDEAHGALWPFSNRLPDSSIHLGADACVQSLHKTGSCLNQGAVLHLAENSGINPGKIQQTLNIINTTSPSYILLASIEASIEYLNSQKGRTKLEKLIDNIQKTKNYLKSNTSAVFLENSREYRHDPTKIFFGLENINGKNFSDFLQENCNMEIEMHNNRGILAFTGIGTGKKHLKKLVKATVKAGKKAEKTVETPEPFPLICPQTAISPARAFNLDSETVGADDAVGRISAQTIVKYPPGIPVLVAGEIIQPEHATILDAGVGVKVIKNFAILRNKQKVFTSVLYFTSS